MNFKPQSEEEVSNLLEKGYADAIILEASDVLSQAGNPMFKMKLRAKDSRGKVVVFFDHVMQGTVRSTLPGGAGWHRADFAEARTLDDR